MHELETKKQYIARLPYASMTQSLEPTVLQCSQVLFLCFEHLQLVTDVSRAVQYPLPTQSKMYWE